MAHLGELSNATGCRLHREPLAGASDRGWRRCASTPYEMQGPKPDRKPHLKKRAGTGEGSGSDGGELLPSIGMLQYGQALPDANKADAIRLVRACRSHGITHSGELRLVPRTT
jgi:hypothetical protein